MSDAIPFIAGVLSMGRASSKRKVNHAARTQGPIGILLACSECGTESGLVVARFPKPDKKNRFQVPDITTSGWNWMVARLDPESNDTYVSLLCPGCQMKHTPNEVVP